MVHTSGQPESRKKRFINSKFESGNAVFDRVHQPTNKTEKERFKEMLGNVYTAEKLYQNGKITKSQRDERIEEAEEIYDTFRKWLNDKNEKIQNEEV